MSLTIAQKESRRKWREANPEKMRAYRAKWAKANPTYEAEKVRAWAAANPEKRRASWQKANAEKATEHAARQRKWRNANRALARASEKAFREANPAYYRARESERRVIKAAAKPAWSIDFFVREAYDLAARRTQSTGIEWHVDHVVPLRSKLVSGLHSHTNLEVIPAVANVAKGNRHWPGMP